MTGPQLARVAASNTVALVHVYEGHALAFCTGVWVDRDVILTANHCVEGLVEMINEENEENPDAPVVLSMGITVQYIVANEVVGVAKMPAALHNSKAYVLSREHDLALLRAVNRESVPYHTIAKLADRVPEQGEDLNIMGHVKGMYWSYIAGTVSAYRKDLPERLVPGKDVIGPFMQVSAPVFFGNSGGGAFNSNGELVGIASFLSRAPNMAFFIPTSPIRTLLESNGVIPIVLDLTAPDPSLEK